MQLGQRLIHHFPEHLREPVVGPQKFRKIEATPHNQMEMRDYEIRFVQVDVQHRLRQERALIPPVTTGNKANGEQTWANKPDAPAPNRAQPVNVLIADGNPNAHGHDRKRKSRVRLMPS